MPKQSKSQEVPPDVQARFDEIVQLTDAYSQEHLNDEYKVLCRELAATLFRNRAPLLTKGKVVTCACAIVHAVGIVNFLSDPDNLPYVPSSQIPGAFGISANTMQSKSKQIRDFLDMYPANPEWTLPSLLDSNPLVWMMNVNGVITNIRNAPRVLQEEAFRRGLIPYIPADR